MSLQLKLQRLARELDGFDAYAEQLDGIVAQAPLPDGTEVARSDGRWWFRPPMSSAEAYCSLRPTYQTNVLCCVGGVEIVWAVEVWAPRDAPADLKWELHLPTP